MHPKDRLLRKRCFSRTFKGRQGTLTFLFRASSAEQWLSDRQRKAFNTVWQSSLDVGFDGGLDQQFNYVHAN